MARPTMGSLPTMAMVIGVEAFRRIDGPMGRFKLTGDSVVYRWALGCYPPSPQPLAAQGLPPTSPPESRG
jgi:hypothetical protein